MKLKDIKNPLDIKNLPLDQLYNLSDEIREKIISILALNGGHLASNLGIVELTIALHKSFNSPIDKFIYDVSHQTYAHKLLTNRFENFDSLRQLNGISGFCHPKESKHDHFYLGHAGTALSLGLGLAKSRDLNNENEFIVPIIGDASLTCGLTLEGFNNIDKNLKNFVVILNDNKMAISKNVGNIKNVLSRLLNNPKANKLYTDIEKVLSKIPGYGKAIASQSKTVLESIKNLVSSAAFFEHLGLSYIGPIDGHDIKKMADTFEAIKKINKPAIIHVLTTKGKGMSKALENPTCYHGVKPFDKHTGKFHKSSNLTFPKVFGKHVLEMADQDPSVVVINPAMMQGSALTDFMEKHPNRCIDVGIAEGHAVTLAGGLGLNKNNKVIVSIYSTFLQRAFDNIFHDVCIQNTPIVFAIDRAGISGPDGVTHHGIYDISFLNAMPNMIIAQPRNAEILKSLLNKAFSFKQPVTIRYPNLPTEDTNNLKNINLLSYDVISKGKDLLILPIGHMYKLAIDIKEKLKEHKLNPTILDPIFIKPLNIDLYYELLSSHKYVVTLEEHSVNSGFGSIFNNFLIQNNYSDIKVLNFGIPQTFIQHGQNKDLFKQIGLTSDNICKDILEKFDLEHKNIKVNHDNCTTAK